MITAIKIVGKVSGDIRRYITREALIKNENKEREYLNFLESTSRSTLKIVIEED